MIIDDYVEKINEWATERGLNKTSNDKQLTKLVEELGELHWLISIIPLNC